MKRLMRVSVVLTVVLSACASEPAIDYSKADIECARICQKNDAECKSRFATLPTILYTHCKPELTACVKACPPPGATVAAGPADSNTTKDKPPVADRLKQLEELHKSGAITDKEYAEIRQEILKSL